MGLIFHEFLVRAAECPESVAIAGPDGELTYAMLEKASRSLAFRLSGLADRRTGVILAERGPEVIIGMLACARAGHPFVAIDPSYPPRRIGQLMGISGCGFVLQCLKTIEIPLENPGCRQFGIDIEALLREPAATLPDQAISSGDPAYLLFTSGTTGTPKCIACHHDPLLNFVRWQVRTFGLFARDRFSMLSGLSHDPVMRDIFTPLSIGASIHIPAQDTILRPGGLREWMLRAKPTVAHMTPPMGQVLAAGGDAEQVSSLKYIFWGGDALKTELISRMKRVAPLHAREFLWIDRNAAGCELVCAKRRRNRRGPDRNRDRRLFHPRPR